MWRKGSECRSSRRRCEFRVRTFLAGAHALAMQRSLARVSSHEESRTTLLCPGACAPRFRCWDDECYGENACEAYAIAGDEHMPQMIYPTVGAPGLVRSLSGAGLKFIHHHRSPRNPRGHPRGHPGGPPRGTPRGHPRGHPRARYGGLFGGLFWGQFWGSSRSMVYSGWFHQLSPNNGQDSPKSKH